MDGWSIFGRVFALIFVALCALGIGLEFGTKTRIGEELPSTYKTFVDFIPLIAAGVALAAAIWAGRLVWRQLEHISLQSDVQTRSLLHARAEGAADFLKTLRGFQVELNGTFPHETSFTETIRRLTAFIDVSSITYLNDKRFDDLFRRALDALHHLSTRLEIDQVNFERIPMDFGSNVHGTHVAPEIPDEVEDSLRALFNAFSVFLHQLRVRIIEIDERILPLKSSAR